MADIKLKLKVKDVEIELSREDAEELRDVLNDLVGERQVIHEHHYPWRYLGYPYWHWDTTGGIPAHYTGWCTSSGAVTVTAEVT